MKKSKSIVAASVAFALFAWAPQAYALCEGCGLLMKLEDVKAADAKAPAPVTSSAGEKAKPAGAKQRAHVKMEDGKTRTVDLTEPTKFKVGDKVKIVGNGLAPQ